MEGHFLPKQKFKKKLRDQCLRLNQNNWEIYLNNN